MFEFKYDLPVSEFFLASQEALGEHWEQVAGFKDKIKLNPDQAKYELLKDAGVLRSISMWMTARL